VLLNAVASDKGRSEPLSLDYDKRMRAPPLETSAAAALAEFESTQQRIRQLFADDTIESDSNWQRDLDRNVVLAATTPSEVEVGSTLGREVSNSGREDRGKYAL
jgi:hypothetical protein